MTFLAIQHSYTNDNLKSSIVKGSELGEMREIFQLSLFN